MQSDVVLNLEVTASNPVYNGCVVTNRQVGKQSIRTDKRVAKKIVSQNIEKLLMKQLDELPRFPYPRIVIEEEDAPAYVRQSALIWATGAAFARRALKDVKIVSTKYDQMMDHDIGRAIWRFTKGARISEDCSAKPRSSRPHALRRKEFTSN